MLRTVQNQVHQLYQKPVQVSGNSLSMSWLKSWHGCTQPTYLAQKRSGLLDCVMLDLPFFVKTLLTAHCHDQLIQSTVSKVFIGNWPDLCHGVLLASQLWSVDLIYHFEVAFFHFWLFFFHTMHLSLSNLTSYFC